MGKSEDPRVTWNKFLNLLQLTVEAWKEHQNAMVTNRGIAEADLNCRDLLYDFWRSSFDQMIDRFLSFCKGVKGIRNFKDLVVEIPKETKKEEKKEGGK